MTLKITPPQSATLLYDGDCGFCQVWVAYFVQKAPGLFIPQAFQTWNGNEIPESNLRSAVHLVKQDGSVLVGAHVFAELFSQMGVRWPLFLYRHGGAFFADRVYYWIARHRKLSFWFTQGSFGIPVYPLSLDRMSDWFLRGLGFIYAMAFFSLQSQVIGLLGSDGVMPLEKWLSPLSAPYLRISMFFSDPSLFWLWLSDRALSGAAWLGFLCGVAMVVFPAKGLLRLACWFLYLSFVNMGGVFFQYQWDALLLEAGMLALLLPWGEKHEKKTPRMPVVLLFRFLLFRLLLGSGLLKILSGDPSWLKGSALQYHFETQPLPTVLSYYAAQAPSWLKCVGTEFTLVCELFVPFFFFAPRRLRMWVGWGPTVLLQVLILLTGNFAWFNYLTLLLTLFLLDDRVIENLFLRTRNHDHQGGAFATCSLPP